MTFCTRIDTLTRPKIANTVRTSCCINFIHWHHADRVMLWAIMLDHKWKVLSFILSLEIVALYFGTLPFCCRTFNIWILNIRLIFSVIWRRVKVSYITLISVYPKGFSIWSPIICLELSDQNDSINFSIMLSCYEGGFASQTVKLNVSCAKLLTDISMLLWAIFQSVCAIFIELIISATKTALFLQWIPQPDFQMSGLKYYIIISCNDLV